MTYTADAANDYRDYVWKHPSMDDPADNLPIAEKYRLVAKRWVEADEAASLLEETKTIVFSEMVGKLLEMDLKMAVNRAELLAKSSGDYKEFVTKMVKQRSAANLLKVQMRYLEMLFQEENSRAATRRAEMKL